MITLDKIGSVTKNLALSHRESVIDTVGTAMGDVLAAQVLEDKRVYNTLELPCGRLSTLKKGDTIAVALGERMALKGFAGRLPETLKTGDVIHLLNLGGVAGECTSANTHEVGEPLRIRVLGAIEREGKPLNIAQATLFAPRERLGPCPPLIVVTGTSMDSGKTTAAAAVLKTLTRIGMRLAGAKLTGVGAWRDLYRMKDYGVDAVASFMDCGIASTANMAKGPLAAMARGGLAYLASSGSASTPDAIMVEFGDGLLGHYGVAAILADPEISACVRLHIGCASDPVGALGLARECAALGLPLDILAGPVTDNAVGRDFLRAHLPGVTPFNAFTPDTTWLNLVVERWLAGKALQA
ncbi:MAG TPA: hypothetical protein DDX54_01570 [Rhodospirillaceae bacterium]|nr:hypothetical protein [Alphaproteobacteria bacterium]HBH26078.1 hypothetical protein [Rhodospirillaceae bacterium]